MLIGILGDKALSDYGYPDPHTSGSIHILHRILDKARVEVILKVISQLFLKAVLVLLQIVEENYLCHENCKQAEKSIDEVRNCVS